MCVNELCCIAQRRLIDPDAYLGQFSANPNIRLGLELEKFQRLYGNRPQRDRRQGRAAVAFDV